VIQSSKKALLNSGEGAGPRARRTLRRGVAAVEFALIAPILCTLVLGIIELSRGLEVKDLLNDAARKGCRLAILPQNPTDNTVVTNTGVTAEVQDIMNDNDLNTRNLAISIKVNGSAVDVSTASQGDQISVKVAIPVSDTKWWSTYFLAGSVIESETIVMMRQD
jgi:Flp pilus assembly protein TadG